MSRETVGKISRDLLINADKPISPIEYEREMHKDYEKNVWECATRCSKEFPANSNFYVIVTTKKEKLMENVIRNYFFGRQSCPTPEFDQTVYKYRREDEDLEFMWVLPSKDTCELFYVNAVSIVEEEKELRDHIINFYNGDLLRLSKRLNKEAVSSNIIEEV